MRTSENPKKILAAILACLANCGYFLSASAAESAGQSKAPTQFDLQADRKQVLSSLKLDDAVFLSAMRLAPERPIILPPQPVSPDSLTASTSQSLATSSIIPLLNAPSDLYDLLKSNQLVQIVSDVELSGTKSDAAKEGNGKGLIRNLIVTLQNDSPQLVELAKSSTKQKPGHNHTLEAAPMEWQGEGDYWYATALDAKHLLVSNKQGNSGRVKSRFVRLKPGKSAASATVTAKAQTTAFDSLPNRMKLLFADAAGDPELWQVLDTSIVNRSNASRASNQLCDFADDKTSIVSFVEPGATVLKTVVYSTNKSAADRLRRELNDFKEPAEFDLKKIADSKFSITISGTEPKSVKTKVFLLLLTGPLSAS
ncbi:MAG: hypothetical protein QG574_1243 [Cyanobacteriota bacterium erpe_2018_sw_21hr_WHONDRS-SW48-000092_B_bin.40]|nr:hypothetical protein [Cyanobacteriota bacterium erpe_2018_sw_21hr_WHONDRS-SW48-000092_B_bin.40]